MLLPGGIAMAEEAEALTSGDYEYTFNDDGSASITRYRGKAEALSVPAELDGHTVTSIGDEAFTSCGYLTTITLPDSVTSIGKYAFAECPKLTLTVPRDSYALAYAKENGIPYTYPDSMNWLNG